MLSFLVLPLLAQAVPTSPSVLRLPAPTGRYAVGTNFLLAHDLGTRAADERPHTIQAQIWYPSLPRPEDPPTLYVGQALRTAMKASGYLEQPADLVDAWADVPTRAHIGAPVAPEALPLPVLLVSPELGFSHHQYTALGEELASHGFAVLALDHPRGGMAVLPDGSALTRPAGIDPLSSEDLEMLAVDWSRDITIVLDRLGCLPENETPVAGHLDLEHVGLLGHSLGAAAALEAADRDRRVAAVVAFQVGPLARLRARGLRVPTLVLLAGPPALEPPDRTAPGASWQDLAQLHAGHQAGLRLACVHLAGPLGLSDAPFVLHNRPELAGPGDAEQAFGVLATLALRFLDEHLRGGDWRALAESVEGRADVTLETLAF